LIVFIVFDYDNVFKSVYFAQSCGHLVLSSASSHIPFPQTGLQSLGHVLMFSVGGSQTLLPHVLVVGGGEGLGDGVGGGGEGLGDGVGEGVGVELFN
jgi:hypothetical protein